MWLEDEVGTNKDKLRLPARLPITPAPFSTPAKLFALLLVNEPPTFYPTHRVRLSSCP